MSITTLIAVGYLAQQGGLTSLLGTTNVTVAGLLLIAIVALVGGFVSPKSSVEEIRARLRDREEEVKVLHADNITQREEKAALRGQLDIMQRQLEQMQKELEELRRELRRFRTEYEK
jgi:chromosome segregation ATPase